MGKRVRHQRRGKGSPTWRSTIHGKEVKYLNIEDKQRTEILKGQVVNLLTDPTHYAVLAEVLFENNEKAFSIAAEGMSIGQTVEYGEKAVIEIGNVLKVKNIVEGCPVFNIESQPGDGGRFVRSSGSYALVVTKDKDKVYIKMPSGKSKAVLGDCRATIGCVAGGGRTEKPFVKAGKKHHLMKSKSRKFAKTRGVAMNPLDHPFGGSQHHAGKSKSTKRGSPPGRSVGAIASRRTGRRKKS